jgi:hypothetical protein
MDTACLAIHKIKAYIDCIRSIDLVPTLLITEPLFNRSDFPALPQCLCTIPEELRGHTVLFKVAKNIEIVYDMKYGVIDFKSATKFYSFPVECVQSVKCHNLTFTIHDTPPFIQIRSAPILKLVVP